ncbi:NepR family anti-sigma factor [Dongia deserti]|uniref:NepR family anti-sigma factor n=1 Tax=Dongia deserti TaxID=2268030 RepID=UPI000E65C37E|nr:NepR family anti-sigma factor [Dongia deserti]
MATASKKSPSDNSDFGAAHYASGVRSVSKDDKDKGVKSEVITSQSSQTRAKKGRRAPAVLDRWFDAQLGRLYADVASEPVPVEMLQLIAKLKKPKQPGS